MLGGAAESAFNRFFARERPPHGELIAFAVCPDLPEADGGRTLAELPPATSRNGACPICTLPTTVFHAGPEALDPDLLATIRNENPGWEPAEGICVQCVDLYSSRLAPGSLWHGACDQG